MKPDTEIVAYSSTAAALTDLETRYKSVVYEVVTVEGMAAAKAAYKDINSHSLTLEAARVKEKAESLAYGRRVDSEAKLISDRLDALRLPVKAQIETETKRVEREREEKVRLELERLAAEEKARNAAEEARMAVERAAINRERAELEEKRQASAKAEADARRQIEDEQRASREKIEADERAARRARDEADRQTRLAREAEEMEAKALRDAEEARLKVERDRLDADRRAVEERERTERLMAEATEREAREAEEGRLRAILREKNEGLDGRAMLTIFKQRFGRRKEFAGVVKAIDACLAVTT